MISPFPSIPRSDNFFLEHKYIWTAPHLSNSFFVPISIITHSLFFIKDLFDPMSYLVIQKHKITFLPYHRGYRRKAWNTVTVSRQFPQEV